MDDSLASPQASIAPAWFGRPTAVHPLHLALLRELLRPVFGVAAHSLIHACARRSDTFDGLLRELTEEFVDPVLGEAFGSAARVALVVAPLPPAR